MPATGNSAVSVSGQMHRTNSPTSKQESKLRAARQRSRHTLERGKLPGEWHSRQGRAGGCYLDSTCCPSCRNAGPRPGQQSADAASAAASVDASPAQHLHLTSLYAKHHVHRGPILNIVVSQGPVVLQLFPHEDQTRTVTQTACKVYRSAEEVRGRCHTGPYAAGV